MSIRTVRWVLEHSPTKGADRLLLLVYAEHANDAGLTWVGSTTLAAEANCGVRAVIYTKRRLEVQGAISIEARPGRTDLITIAGVQSVAGVQQTTTEGAIGCRTGVQPGADEPPENRKEPPTPRTRASTPARRSSPAGGSGKEEDSNPHPSEDYWRAVVEGIPNSKVQRKLNAESPRKIARLKDAVAQAEHQGMRISEFKRLWDAPGPLDDPDINSVASVLAHRITIQLAVATGPSA